MKKKIQIQIAMKSMHNIQKAIYRYEFFLISYFFPFINMKKNIKHKYTVKPVITVTFI